MKVQISFVDNILSQFSYLFKIRFLVILGFLYVLFLSFVVFYLKLPYILFIVLMAAFIPFILMYATKAIRRPLENLKIAAKSFSGGDLTVRAPIVSRDEVADIARAFNEMAALFEKGAVKVDQISSSCFQGAAEILKILKDQESASAFQEEVLKKMKVKAHGNTLKINHFFHAISEVNKRFTITAELAVMGRTHLNEMQKILSEMKAALSNIIKALSMLKEQTGKVAEIVELLVEIADQSNLLFLNTAIKAYKTGKEGAGLIIIADKIRELADETSASILGMEQSLSEIMDEVTAATAESDVFAAYIASLDQDNKIVTESLIELIEQTHEHLNTLKKIDFEKEEQFSEYAQMDELNAQLGQQNFLVGNNIRRLLTEAELLFQGAQKLKPPIEQTILHK